MPIRVVILADLINEVNLMPNCILIIPYIVVSSCTLVLSLWNAKNQPYPTVNCLDAPILIIIPIKLSTVQQDIDMVILQVKGSWLVIKGTILSIVVTKWLKALLARVTAIEIVLYCFTWLKEV